MVTTRSHNSDVIPAGTALAGGTREKVVQTFGAGWGQLVIGKTSLCIMAPNSLLSVDEERSLSSAVLTDRANKQNGVVIPQGEGGGLRHGPAVEELGRPDPVPLDNSGGRTTNFDEEIDTSQQIRLMIEQMNNFSQVLNQMINQWLAGQNP